MLEIVEHRAQLFIAVLIDHLPIQKTEPEISNNRKLQLWTITVSLR